MDQSEIKPRKFPKFFWTILIVLLIVFGIIFAKAYNVGNKVFTSKTSFFKKITSLVFHSDGGLKGGENDRVNVLLLGYGGGEHDGTYLTDTLILATFQPSSNEVLLSSIPRDYLWEKGRAKINFAFANEYEKTKDFNKAGEEAAKAVAEVTGEAIPYYATVDFSGFEKAVDRVGGLDINVERTFTDAQYPDENYGYLPPLTFTAGQNHMNGIRALEFARSRHGNNFEDSDFARSKRQALIITAFRDKVNNLNILSSATKINDLVNILADHVHTNLDPNELVAIANLAKQKDSKVLNQSLDLDTGLVCSEIRETEGYVLLPCPGVSKENIKSFFADGFAQGKIRAENPEIILENAGTDTALYIETKRHLTALGIAVYEVPYKGLPVYSSTIYQINDKPATINYLEDKLGVRAQEKPAAMTAKADLVVIIGGR